MHTQAADTSRATETCECQATYQENESRTVSVMNFTAKNLIIINNPGRAVYWSVILVFPSYLPPIYLNLHFFTKVKQTEFLTYTQHK